MLALLKECLDINHFKILHSFCIKIIIYINTFLGAIIDIYSNLLSDILIILFISHLLVSKSFLLKYPYAFADLLSLKSSTDTNFP